MADLQTRIAPETIRKVAIIGAGPSGIAAAKYVIWHIFLYGRVNLPRKLILSRSEIDITIYEQRSNVGGIWNPDSLAPAHDVELFPSPIYEALESNLTKEVMMYHDFAFQKDCHLYPDTKQILAYLTRYAEGVKGLVRFRRKVLAISPAEYNDSHRCQWRVRSHGLADNTQTEQLYDAVVVANGRHNLPFVPRYQGAEEWGKALPESVMHANTFKGPDKFVNKVIPPKSSAESCAWLILAKKVVLVGYSSSGVDIAEVIAPVCLQPIIVCKRSLKAGFDTIDETGIQLRFRPQISEMDHTSRTVYFEDGSSETGIDLVVFCTGYRCHYPFLTSLPGFEAGSDQGNVPMYKHMIMISHPTLAILGVPTRIIAFPFAESQASLLAAFWSGKIHLPSQTEMEAEVAQNVEEHGEKSRAYHAFGSQRELRYLDQIRDLLSTQLSSADPLVPPSWSSRKRWLRPKGGTLRKLYEAMGERRLRCERPEDIVPGVFDFSEIQS